FFRARRGRARGFRFRDWTDYTAQGQPIGTGDGETAVFQLAKRYESGGVAVIRPLRKPVAGTVAVYLDGAAQSSGFSVDDTTGEVTFGTAPAEGVAVTVDCEFDVPVRFDSDSLSASIDDYGVHSW